jgi:hypothetical protein
MSGKDQKRNADVRGLRGFFADRWRREAGVTKADLERFLLLSLFLFLQYPRSSAQSAKIRGKQLQFVVRAQIWPGE